VRRHASAEVQSRQRQGHDHDLPRSDLCFEGFKGQEAGYAHCSTRSQVDAVQFPLPVVVVFGYLRCYAFVYGEDKDAGEEEEHEKTNKIAKTNENFFKSLIYFSKNIDFSILFMLHKYNYDIKIVK
jgi:hypothetical protein